MSTILFDKQKLVLTVLENVQSEFNQEQVSQHVEYMISRLKEADPEVKDPFDKEKIILPRQKTFIQITKEKNKFRKEKRTRMIWSDEKKGWMLRRNKRKSIVIPPVIEATKKDAYEDVFRKREIQEELNKSKLKLRKMQKTVKKIKQKK